MTGSVLPMNRLIKFRSQMTAFANPTYASEYLFAFTHAASTTSIMHMHYNEQYDLEHRRTWQTDLKRTYGDTQ